MKFINFNDSSLPIGKRKQAYVKWAISKGTDPMTAKKQANKKFGFEQSKGILAVVTDFDNRRHQNSFTGEEEIFDCVDLSKYKEHKYVWSWDKEIETIKNEARKKDWRIIYIGISS